jgi:hypothetical protein
MNVKIKKLSYSLNRPWRPRDVFSVRYEHNLCIKKVILVTGRGGP